MSLTLSDFDYNLPKNLIASKPHEPRDECKLLVFNRSKVVPERSERKRTESKGLNGLRQAQAIIHTRFDKIINFLNPGDVLVLNDTKVIPARLFGRRIDEQGKLGRKFKVLLLSPLKSRRSFNEDGWEVLIDGKKRNVGIKINFGSGLIGEILKSPAQPPPFKKGEERRGIWEMKFNKSGKEFQNLISKIGKMPLPPYIKLEKSDFLRKSDFKWYQTVYAKYLGSVAAPTAGLHFTKKLLDKIKRKGVQIEYITLHVGLGTFLPVKVEDITKHKMHPEYIEISAKTATVLNKAKKEGIRIIAVGTTTTRALEALAFCHPECKETRSPRETESRYNIKPFKGEINIFIYPPYKFKFVDALITNFHLPKSTLLMLVSALIGQKLPANKAIKIVKNIYNEAINKKYRFYSYGDAMFIL